MYSRISYYRSLISPPFLSLVLKLPEVYRSRKSLKPRASPI